MVSPHDDPIELVESKHDEWCRLFKQERARLDGVLDSLDQQAHAYRLEHVGSTAVDGLAAKDIVDIDIVVPDDDVADVSDAIVTHLGGTRHENTPTWHPVFRRADGQRFNDHVFGRSDPKWRISVATVAALRDRPDLRERYERLKRETAAETDDLESYSVAKTSLVGELLDHAATMDLGIAVPSVE